MNTKKAIAAIVFLCSLVPGARSQTSEGADVDTRLVLLLMVDQLPYEYLERFSPLLEGGLKRLAEEGVVFTDAHQAHASTSTGPGHATVSTGSYPRHSGIIGNSWFDRSRNDTVNCVQDDASGILRSGRADPPRPGPSGRSPRHLLVSSLGDWLKERDSRSRAFGVSRKDRGAILPAGLKADGAFWYDSDTGEFVSSQYYFQKLPAWVDAFMAERLPDRFFGKVWEPLPVTPEMYQKLEILPADRGWFESSFPYSLGGTSLSPNSAFYSSFGSTPWMDWYMLRFAERLVEEERLGQGEAVDLLGLSFSVLDSVGHTYGPNSPEVLDCVLRLDRTLAELFEFLDRSVGLERVLIAFTADHGVVPLPEYRRAQGKEGARRTTEDTLCVQRAGSRFFERFGQDDWLLSGTYFNYETLGRKNVRRQDVETELARLLGTCPNVERVWTRTQLEREPEAASSDHFFQLYWRNFHADRSGDLFVQPRKYYLGGTGTGTSHGSPYRYDTHVPIIFWNPGFEPALVSETAATVDIAPTLASVLGLQPPDELDGEDRSSHLKRR